MDALLVSCQCGHQFETPIYSQAIRQVAKHNCPQCLYPNALATAQMVTSSTQLAGASHARQLPPAVRQAPVAKPTPRRSATELWEESVASFVAKGMSKMQAVREVVTTVPQLYEQYLTEFNANHGGKR
ncbi:hypothetical protein [Blastopirellula marina]|uniref:Uncharacterized protein n=1 Tax=Blastopirellula marina DSM 3645 TaxID=314230 RepID=A3ZUY8_9BACT|nr:hypothetical protein [Blastopirellula marina]EAQ79724.1 hypothetical protein DSM3645_24485 [Blastopirellula marina DSM 3645]